MTITKDHALLAQGRIAAALLVLNDALADANRVGLRTVVQPSGPYGNQSVTVELLNPIDLKLRGGA